MILGALCVLPVVTPAVALALGAGVGLILGNPFITTTSEWSKRLLKVVVVGLGFGLSAGQVAQVGSRAAVFTAIGITATFGLGWLLWRVLRTERTTSLLVTTGTAICGGSAIAAMAPVLRAGSHQTAVAMATVFTLNAVGLWVFPPIGMALGLSQAEFGTWAAIAIHDTSSVVGACAQYGAEAELVGTTVKLTRALWIVPMAFVAAMVCRSEKRATVPLFLVGFVVAAGVRSVAGEPIGPVPTEVWDGIRFVVRRLLEVTLFLIGAGLTREVLGRVGLRPLILGVALWVIVSVTTLGAIRFGVIPAVSVDGGRAETTATAHE